MFVITMNMRTLLFFLTAFAFSSCASLNTSLLFEEDDVYYTDDFQHRFNKQALLQNKDVAMPDSSYSYFDETYAESIRTSYSKQIDRFSGSDTTSTYFSGEEQNMDYYNDQQARSNRWLNNVSMGVGYGVGFGASAYYGGAAYQPFYGSYYSPSYSGATGRMVSGRTVMAPASTSESYRPFIPYGNNRQNTGISSRGSQYRQVYRAPNTGMKGKNMSRQYNSRSSGSSTNGGVWSSPGYFNGGSSRGGGSYSPGGSVGGFRRR